MPNRSPGRAEEGRGWEVGEKDERKALGNRPLRPSSEPSRREIRALQEPPAASRLANSAGPTQESQVTERQPKVEAGLSGNTNLDTLLAAKREALEAICRRFRVRRLAVFGSTLEGESGHASDVDFLVEFDVPEIAGYAHRFFGLKEALEQLLGRQVDLVIASAITNPFFRRVVEERKVLVYGD